MPTGLKSYYILRCYKAVGGWVNWTFVRVAAGDVPHYVSTLLEATPFKTHEDAEKAAFNLAVRNPPLMGELVVELRSV